MVSCGVKPDAEAVTELAADPWAGDSDTRAGGVGVAVAVGMGVAVPVGLGVGVEVGLGVGEAVAVGLDVAWAAALLI